jgi:hypothetical protein
MSAARWEQTADRLAAAGWSWGCLQALIAGRLVWVVDAHRDDGHRFVAHAPVLDHAFDLLQESLPHSEGAP